jgi:adenosylcobinamide-GDP ribazoletransferase
VSDPTTEPSANLVARRLDELILALTLLTRIPMPPARAGDSAALGRAVWAYPLVGALVGGMGAAAFAAARALGVPADAAAWLALAVMVLATGCFHEDGLADFWDGIGGGRTIARKLEIMRDSRIGSYGAAALILSFGLRASLVSSLDGHGLAEAGLVAAGLLGRTAIAAVLAILPPARDDGLAATAAAPPAGRVAVALAWPVLLLTILPVQAVFVFCLAAGLAAGWMIALMRRQIEGYTGDGLGATEQTVELAVLIACAALAAG